MLGNRCAGKPLELWADVYKPLPQLRAADAVCLEESDQCRAVSGRKIAWRGSAINGAALQLIGGLPMVKPLARPAAR